MTETMATFEEVLEKLTLIEQNAKQTIKDVKALMKLTKTKKKKDPNAEDSGEKKLTGFNKPVKVCPELAGFMGIKSDELISRTDVNKKVNAYIKEKQMQNPEKKSEIKLDKKLADLFGKKKDDIILYKQLQTCLKPLYPKD